MAGDIEAESNGLRVLSNSKRLDESVTLMGSWDTGISRLARKPWVLSLLAYSCCMVTAAMKLKDAYSSEEKL